MKPTVMRSLGAVEPSAPSALDGMMTGAATNVAAVDLRNCRREIWFSFIKDLSVGKSFLLPARFLGKGEDDDCVRRAMRPRAIIWRLRADSAARKVFLPPLPSPGTVAKALASHGNRLLIRSVFSPVAWRDWLSIFR